MSEAINFFDDGEAYERAIGRWSRVAGDIILDWLSLSGGLKWLDAGCGTGAFTRLVLERCAPEHISAIDPSTEQIEYAEAGQLGGPVNFHQGDAMALRFGADAFDAAIMALVIQYISDRPKAMSEFRRVVRPGGTVAAYVWEGPDAGHPHQPIFDARNSLGIHRHGPGGEIRSIAALTDLFEASGLKDVDSRVIGIQLNFDDFDDFWSSQTALAAGKDSDPDTERVKALVRERLVTGEDGPISYMARANAVRGQVPG
jgi:SAM-dependent methyltransferase